MILLAGLKKELKNETENSTRTSSIMPPTCNKENPDSLQTLLQKARAIKTVNDEIITQIHARKGKQVIVKHHYTLQTKPSTNKNQKPQLTENFQLINKKSTKNVDDIIAAWRYHSEPLQKEKIAVDNFIDRNLVGFDDLLRLNDEYSLLLDKYSRILTDEIESRAAVERVMRNIEVLQVAIGKIHEQVLDVANSDEVNDAISLLVENFSKEWKAFRSKVSGVQFNVDLQTDVDECKRTGDICKFGRCTSLSCKHTLSGNHNPVHAVQTYVLNDKQYLVCGNSDRMINLWDLRNNTVVATLSDDSRDNTTLALYVKNGVQMMASNNFASIKLWNLSNNTKEYELLGHDDWINTLTVYEKDSKVILISGSSDKTIKIWDLESYTNVITLQGHTDAVYQLVVYNHDNKQYLASGGVDKYINIWSLHDYSLVKALDSNGVKKSLLAIDHNTTPILASGNNNGIITLWSIENYDCLKMRTTRW